MTGAAGPAFSVVLPVYQSDLGHLVTALRSIQQQRWTNWECQVVDDGSADRRVAAVVRSFAAADPRFELAVSLRNQGIAAATNTAIGRSTGEWVVFCDHDDVMHPDALERIARRIAIAPLDDLIYTDEQMVDGSGALVAEHRKPDHSPERLLGQNYVAHLLAVRRSLLHDLGAVTSGGRGPVDPTFEPCQDNDLVLRATTRARSVGHVAEILYSWRAGEGSIAASTDHKSGVAAAVAGAAAAQLARLGHTATVDTIPGSPTTVRILRHPPATVSVTRIEIDRSTSPSDIDRALADATSDLVALVPRGAVGRASGSGDWTEPLIAQCAREGVAAAGPRLVSDDAKLISAGRVHYPALRDVCQGVPADEHGPWGAFLVARECASLSPWGLVLRLDRYRELGGVQHDLGLDAAVAELCTRLRLSGQSSIWTPLSTLVLTADHLDDHASLARRDADVARALRRCPALATDPYSPLGAFG